MSQSCWYHDKASECDRMALASTNAVTRGRHIKDRDNWREIAARIDAAEQVVEQRDGEAKAPSEPTLVLSDVGTDTGGGKRQMVRSSC
jgi:hypothetical protein